ncbi:RNA polymerase sigma factor [Qiania dongpingensis]|uniref:RNA polymerase sigma factor n=1 Tax=Qiania dongpingensis TaxID=2763669 RepID=A0A7G9G5A2_9FIRM|nr:RNA polymerase sigma factor [Qiania dongpingensis]QNM05984.1 RNA polymerase sigma factor [Qiania dongpingensis]
MDIFEEIYIAYKDDIYRFIYKLTGYDSALSEELLSETFFRAFVSFGNFKGLCEIKTWLCQIAKNTYSGYVRSEIRKKRLFSKFEKAEKAEDFTEDIENKELLFCIQSILKGCDKKARDIVQYRMFAGLKFKEIASILDMKETTAKVIFYRTRAVIQIQLKEKFGYEV